MTTQNWPRYVKYLSIRRLTNQFYYLFYLSRIGTYLTIKAIILYIFNVPCYNVEFTYVFVVISIELVSLSWQSIHILVQLCFIKKLLIMTKCDQMTNRQVTSKENSTVLNRNSVWDEFNIIY